jgi:hypothetical protein
MGRKGFWFKIEHTWHREIDLTIPRTFTRANLNEDHTRWMFIAEFVLFYSLCSFLFFMFINKNKEKTIHIRGWNYCNNSFGFNTLFYVHKGLWRTSFFPWWSLEAAIREVIDNPDRPISVQQLRNISILIFQLLNQSLDGIENLKICKNCRQEPTNISDLTP